MCRILIFGKPAASFLAGISLFTLATSGIVIGHISQAQAQTMAQQALDTVFVDISDPNITIDLSVIEDGGRAPLMTVPTRPITGHTGSPSHKAQYRSPKFPTSNTQAPQVIIPTSTLYIQPATNRKLPPQTKPLIIRPAPKLSVAEAVPVAPASNPVASKQGVAATPPAAKAKTASITTAPAAASKAPAAPDLGPVMPVASSSQTPDDKASTTKMVKAQARSKTKTPTALAPVSAPITKVTSTKITKVVPAKPIASPPPVARKIKKSITVAAKTVHKTVRETPAPPPPPQALTKTAIITKTETVKTATKSTTKQNAIKTPVVTAAPKTKTAKTVISDETQTAPTASGNSVVVDLPPRDQATAPSLASVPPASASLGDGDNMRIVFEQNSSKLPKEARQSLKALSKQLQGQNNMRLQLLAYAGNADTSASAARRLSLSRALAVRSYLIESGVRSTRIDVRALGNKSSDEVTERVDITVVER